MATFIEQLKTARRVSTPLVVIETQDASATIETTRDALNGSGVLRWDIVRGCVALNEAGLDVLRAIGIPEKALQDGIPVLKDPSEFVVACQRFPEKVLAYVINWHKYLTAAPVLQGTANLRDSFKADFRTFVMLVPVGTKLPVEIQNDVQSFREPLPEDDQLRQILADLCEEPGIVLSEADIVKACDILRGLNAFAAETCAALALRKDGIDFEALWQRKKVVLEATKGCKIQKHTCKRDEIGGLTGLMEFADALADGEEPARMVVQIEEIEKAMAGSTRGAHVGDSGVSQDIHAEVLTWLQDEEIDAVMLAGAGGTGKSLFGKVLGSLYDCPTIVLDLAGVKGGVVGESEQNIRRLMQVVQAASGGRVVVVATSNNADALSPELRSRFSLGTYYVDLPDAVERKAIWQISLRKHGLDVDQPTPADEGWSGRNIDHCCRIAKKLRRPVADSIVNRQIVPSAQVEAERLQNLRQAAHNVMLDARTGSVYTNPSEAPKTAQNASQGGKRKVRVTE